MVSDICMPDMDGLELLRYCKEVSPSAAFILITGVPTINTAIDAVNFGADRYVIKGDRLLDELRPAVKKIAETQALKKEAGDLRRRLRKFTGFDHIIGTSPKMRELFDLIETIAPRGLIWRDDYRRKRHGKGTGRPRHSREQRPLESALYHHQLRSLSRNAPRIGIVRLHASALRGGKAKTGTVTLKPLIAGRFSWTK